MSIVDETKASIKAATHLTPADRGAIEALLALAEAFDYLCENDGCSPKGSLDNVTGPTYLRYCESLGLTPGGRAKLGVGGGESKGSRLAQLRAVK